MNQTILRSHFLCSTIFFLGFGIYLTTASTEIFTADCGELTASSYVLGIPHPSGYPLYSLVLKSAYFIIPFGTIAFRATVISILGVSLGLIALFMSIRKMFGEISAFVFSLFMLFSKILWSQAVIQEVYGLHMFWLGISLLATVNYLKNNTLKNHCLLFFILGMSFTHHMMIFLTLPAIAIFLFGQAKLKLFFSRKRLITLIFLCLGWSIYLYLPIRSYNNCAFRWLPVHHFKTFIYHITGKQFRPIMFNISIKEMMHNFSIFQNQLCEQWGFSFLGFAFIGLVILIIQQKYQKLFFLLTYFFVILIFVINYRIVDINVYYIQAFIPITIFIGLGISHLIKLMKNISGYRITIVIFIAFLIAFSVTQFGRNYYFNDKSKNFLAYDYGKNLQNCLPLDSTLITQGWSSPFVFTYFEHVINYRPDILVVVDYKGSTLNRAKKEQWEIPLYTTVLIETQNFNYQNYSIQGLVYRFNIMNNRYFDGWDPWDIMTLTRHNKGPIFHDFHGRALLAKYHYMFGEKCLEDERDILAFHKFRLAEEIGKDNNLILNNLSGIFFRIEKYEEAERLARRSLLLDPYFYQAHHNLGNALLKLEKFDEAIEHFNEGKGRKIALGKSHQALGFGYLKNRNYMLAARELKLAMRFNPDSFELKNNLGVAYINCGKIDDAEKMFLNLLKEYPENSEILNNLGLVKFKLGCFDCAQEYYEQAIKINPDFAESWSNLAIVYAENGRYQKALDLMLKALNLDNNNTSILNNLGLIKLHLDQIKDAENFWRQSLEINPNQLHVWENLRRIGVDIDDLRKKLNFKDDSKIIEN